MKSSGTKAAVALLLSFFVLNSEAADLLRVYNDAVCHDPAFQKAEANWHAQQQVFGIALSDYLPQVNITGYAQQQYQSVKTVLPLALSNFTSSRGSANQYQISASQAIFNAANWFNIKKASATVKAATATYSYAAQNLMLRTGQAYFGVLQAYDQLVTTQASKKAYYREYITAKQKFDVGLIAKTGVYEALSYYDTAVASELADQNNLYDKIEALRAITGYHYHSLNGVKNQVPLIIPAPNDINVWVQIAQSQNYGLISDQFNIVAAHENIRQTAAGNYPVLTAQGAWMQNFSSGRPSLGPLISTTNDVAYGGIALNFPLIQGGLVRASTRQAIFQYGVSSAQFEQDNASIVSNTRQSFLGIVSGVGQIRADKQAIISAEQALIATRAGYTVGTRTMVDVLTDTSNLFKAKQRYYDDQYFYLINIFNLKYAAGTLGPEDLAKINGWLNDRIKFNLPAKLFSPEAQESSRPMDMQKAYVPIVFVPAKPVNKGYLQLPPAASTKPIRGH